MLLPLSTDILSVRQHVSKVPRSDSRTVCNCQLYSIIRSVKASSVGGLIPEGVFALEVYWCCLGKSSDFTPFNRKDQAARIDKTSRFIVCR
jgi:hypothetical protein